MNKFVQIFVLIILFPTSLSSAQNTVQDRSFLEIYKANQQNNVKNAEESYEKTCVRNDAKCLEEKLKEKVEAMLFSDKSEPDASKEYQILCHRCCEGTARKEECTDFGNWAKKEKCGCE